MKTFETDVLVVGAGLVGSSVAMHLSELSKEKITVVDLDLQGTFSSSELNAGGVRATWNHPLNAQISKNSLDYFESIKDEIGFRQNGYLWMYSKDAWPKAKNQIQKSAELNQLKIDFLTASEIQKKYSFLDKTSDIGGATFSHKDGLLNSNLLKLHYRQKAQSNGVEFKNRIWVHSVKKVEKNSIELLAYEFESSISEDEIKKVLTSNSTDLGRSICIKAKKVAHCTGAWAKRFLKSFKIESPCYSVRRQISLFECKGLDLNSFGMFVDTSGVYFHAEAQYILGGFAVEEEPESYSYEYDGESFFEEFIWSKLYDRSTLFSQLKHLTGWAGLYELSPDRAAVVGRVPGFDSVFEAHSFSGRGAMQSYAAGLGLAELMTKGKYLSLDLSALSAERFSKGEEVREDLII